MYDDRVELITSIHIHMILIHVSLFYRLMIRNFNPIAILDHCNRISPKSLRSHCMEKLGVVFLFYPSNSASFSPVVTLS
jgi:hypothetical protein